MFGFIRRWLGLRRETERTSTQRLLERVLELRQQRIDAGDYGPWVLRYSPYLTWTMFTPWWRTEQMPPHLRDGLPRLTVNRIEIIDGILFAAVSGSLSGDAMELVHNDVVGNRGLT